MTENNEYAVRATLKAGGGYDAPWLTVAGHTANEVLFKLKEVQDQGLAEVVAETAKALAGVWTATDVLGGKPVDQPVPAAQPQYQQPQPSAQQYQQAAPQQQAAAPGGQPAPQCRHGERKFVTSKPGASRQWKAWMCPTPQGAADKCEPQWLRD